MTSSESSPTSVSQGLLGIGLGALFLSGVASVINQSIWQRAIKVYLAGSESFSSMIVVFVFMFGLGAGALAVGRQMHRIANPMKAFAVVEILLCLFNLGIVGLLSLDVSSSAIQLQQVAVAVGVPLSLLYMVISALILIIPCLLMGATMPLISAACQTQLDRNDSRFLTVLFVLNTMGAALGSLGSGLFMLPLLGQQKSLLVAITLNALAGFIAWMLYRRLGAPRHSPGGPAAPIEWFARPRREEMLSMWLGFFGLAFEMYLFRVAAIQFTPLPYTFSVMLCAYLVSWSIGVGISKVWTRGFYQAGLWTCLLFLGAAILDGFEPILELEVATYAVFSLPCVGIGLFFGLLMQRVGKSWGEDVGRFYGYNTLGSCLGIFFGVMVCYRFHMVYFMWLCVAGYWVLWLWYSHHLDGALSKQKLVIGGAATLAVSLAIGIPEHKSIVEDTGSTYYFSSQGVVRIDPNLQMQWDGLWHSSLSDGTSHIGTPNWVLAVLPLFTHEPQEELDTLVVGMGTGITAAVLARSSLVKSVDVYEINPILSEMLEDYPEGTLNLASNPKAQIHWQDARIGLALSDKQYDVITQQPLYLKQAGSSMLLSKEYFELMQSKMKPGAIYAIYSNTMGNLDHVMVVRRTAREVFPYVKSYMHSYVILASNEPFDVDDERIRDMVQALPDTDPVKAEMESFASNREELTLEEREDSDLPWDSSPVMVTDDQPIVEYPDLATWLVRRARQ